MNKNDIFWRFICVLGLIFCPAFSGDTIIPPAGQYRTYYSQFDTNIKITADKNNFEKIKYDECNEPANQDNSDSLFYFAIVTTNPAWDRSERGFVVDAHGDVFTYFNKNPHSLYPTL
jgi:hypothetical protein